MDELLDKDAKSELESELCINWSEEVKPPILTVYMAPQQITDTYNIMFGTDSDQNRIT